jgi:hypothetical protein
MRPTHTEIRETAQYLAGPEEVGRTISAAYFVLTMKEED